MPTKTTNNPQHIQELLAEPIDYQWRVKQFYPKGKPGSLEPGTVGQFLAYIDARDVYNRLDSVVGVAGWEDRWELIDAMKNAVRVTLRVNIGGEWVEKSDVGYPNSDLDEEPLKSAVSDGIKRAAIHFGIGRFLYALEPVKRKVDKWGKPLQPLPTNPRQPEQPADDADEPAVTVRPAIALTRPVVRASDPTEQYVTEDGEVLEDGPCEHCGQPATAKNFYYSMRAFNRRLCFTCQQKAKEGILDDPKSNVETEPITNAYGEDQSLPF